METYDAFNSTVKTHNVIAGDDGNPGSCGVNLINEGVIVNEDCARIQFTGCGPVESYLCKLDRNPFRPCELFIEANYLLAPLHLSPHPSPYPLPSVNVYK